MTAEILFPIAEYWWVYGIFLAFVIGMLALDLGVFHRKAHAVTMKEAVSWSLVWVGLAGVVNLVFWWWARSHLAAEGHDPAVGNQLALQFLAGYVVEKALAVDNIFVIAMIFTALSIPPEYRHRVLFYGIIGALAFRALFIGLGAVLMQYHWVVWIAGGFLILTGIKMLLIEQAPPDPANNRIIKLIKRVLPVTPTLEGQRFLVRHGGVLMATPLFIALVMIESADIVFAIDSVPAIFALTNEPLIVFLSNILAILGLRSLYFLLDGAMEKFHLLKYSLSLILMFVGLKMLWLNQLMGGKFPISWSLGIIGALLALGIIGSLLRPKHGPPPAKPAPV